MGKLFTLLTITTGLTLAGLITYAIYFDFKRRNDTQFRKRLRAYISFAAPCPHSDRSLQLTLSHRLSGKENKRFAKTVAQETASSTFSDEKLLQVIEDIKKDEIPNSREEQERYFFTQVDLGDRLIQKGTSSYLELSISDDHLTVNRKALPSHSKLRNAFSEACAPILTRSNSSFFIKKASQSPYTMYVFTLTFVFTRLILCEVLTVSYGHGAIGGEFVVTIESYLFLSGLEAALGESLLPLGLDASAVFPFFSTSSTCSDTFFASPPPSLFDAMQQAKEKAEGELALLSLSCALGEGLRMNLFRLLQTLPTQANERLLHNFCRARKNYWSKDTCRVQRFRIRRTHIQSQSHLLFLRFGKLNHLFRRNNLWHRPFKLITI
jgi:hypothetical protein